MFPSQSRSPNKAVACYHPNIDKLLTIKTCKLPGLAVGAGDYSANRATPLPSGAYVVVGETDKSDRCIYIVPLGNAMRMITVGGGNVHWPVSGRGLQCPSTPSILAFKQGAQGSAVTVFTPSPSAISQAQPVPLSKYSSHLSPPCCSVAPLPSTPYQPPSSSSSLFYLPR